MSTYLLNFIVYTTAMVGIIFLAIIAYKKFSCTTSSASKFLNVEDCISLAPRKNLYIVRAGKERFLVASDAERTTLISKLDETQTISDIDTKGVETRGVDNLPEIVSFSKKKESKKVFKNIINNI